MTERWLPIPGYEGIYEVSDQGRVRSVNRIDAAGRRRAGRQRSLTTRRDDGRVDVSLHRDRGVRVWYVHRLVLLAFVGPAPEGTEGCHNDGNPGNNALSNLRWDTPSENQRDAIRHGTHGQTSKTHCPQGHPYDEKNTYITSKRVRQCRACCRLRARSRRGNGFSLTPVERTPRRV